MIRNAYLDPDFYYPGSGSWIQRSNEKALDPGSRIRNTEKKFKNFVVFSIENFKRDQEEVESLLDLFREKIRLLIAEEKKLAEHGVRVKLIGMGNVEFIFLNSFFLYSFSGLVCISHSFSFVIYDESGF
jgi:hypothetical protein